MKKQYNTARLTTFGSVETLTQYGTGGGSSDVVYLANPAGINAVTFLQGQGFSLSDAQVLVALQIANAGATTFPLALAGVNQGASGRGYSYNPTLGSTFTP